jgi:hypothetical protein
MIRFILMLAFVVTLSGCINDEDYKTINPYLTIFCEDQNGVYDPEERRIPQPASNTTMIYFKCFHDDKITQWQVSYKKSTNTFGDIEVYDHDE